MEVEHSASSKCLGAFERRRETSTREERWEKIEGNMQTIEERLRAEKAAVIIQAFLRTTAVRVKLDRAKYLWGTQRAHIYWVFNTFRLGPWWKDYRERQEAKEKERACGHLDGEWMRLDTNGVNRIRCLV